MLYRFRSTKNLLDYKELEEQYLHFANAKAQNDCLEGHVDFYWQGDFVAWLGLFKYYAWGIYRIILDKFTCGDLVKEEDYDRYLLFTDIYLKDTKLGEERQAIESAVSENQQLRNLAVALAEANIKLTDKELPALLLIFVHQPVYSCLKPILNRNSIRILDGDLVPEIDPELYDRTVFHAGDDADTFRILLQSVQGVIASFLLSSKRRVANLNEEHRKTMNFLANLNLGFPEQFVRQIQKLSYAEVYITCFNDAASNPAMWAHYADNNQGVCLIFKNEPESTMKLSEKPDAEKAASYQLHKIQYGTNPLRVNFFSSLVRLWGNEREHWFKHEGETSRILTELFEDLEATRNLYLQNSINRFLRKSKSWKDEQEYRIVLCDYMGQFKEPPKRYYDFRDLHGIAFGIRTSIEDKIKIMNIVQEKCSRYNREDFIFYQAVYDAQMDEIKLEMLPGLFKIAAGSQNVSRR